MNINAESIQKKEFHVVFKGYKPEEVDKFLDILAVEFDRLHKANRELMDNLERLKYEGDRESSEMKKVIQDALVSAHKIAEDIKKKAEKEAEEIVKTKVSEEEESYKKLLSKKLQLEGEINRLEKEYESFKGRIAKLVDDFKDAASKLEEGKFFDISGISRKDFDIEKPVVEETGADRSKEEKELEEKGLLNSSREKDEFEVFRGSKKEEDKEKTQKKPDMESLEEEEEESTEEEEDKEEKYKDSDFIDSEEEEEQEREKKIGVHGDSEEIEESDDNYQPKRMKKKIDIANPDIINDFFKTDED